MEGWPYKAHDINIFGPNVSKKASKCMQNEKSKNYIMMEIVYYSSGPVTIDLIIIPPMPFEYVHMHAH